MQSSPSNLPISPKRKRDERESAASAAQSSSRPSMTHLPTRLLSNNELVLNGNPRASATGSLQQLSSADKQERPQLNRGECLNTRADSSENMINVRKSEPPSFPSSHNPPTLAAPLQVRGFQPPYTGPKLSFRHESADYDSALPESPTRDLLPAATPPSPAIKPMTPSLMRTLWWSGTEITGHNPDPADPTDDGYGINGVGFIPTPGIANARIEGRKKQIKEWKEREGREARDRRGERRRKKDLDVVCKGASYPEKIGPDIDVERRRVRFLEA